ncbi:hypothetical protein B566_EDAN002072 [Ephemera danica]|nr:hypothetical protein B566_EDAN002072 [Ephemera danica]
MNDEATVQEESQLKTGCLLSAEEELLLSWSGFGSVGSPLESPAMMSLDSAGSQCVGVSPSSSGRLPRENWIPLLPEQRHDEKLRCDRNKKDCARKRVDRCVAIVSKEQKDMT